MILSCNDTSAVLCEAKEHGVESSEESKLVFLTILRLLSIFRTFGCEAPGISNPVAQYQSLKALILAMRNRLG